MTPEKPRGPPIPLLAGVVALVIVIGVVAYFYAVPGQQAAQPTSSQTSVVSPTTASANSTSGLVLQLKLNATVLAPGQTIAADVTEFNQTPKAVNATGASLWAVQGLSIGPCGSNTPLGVGVFKGYYTKGNISSAQALQIYNPGVYACPAFFHISSFLFQPDSDNATIAGSCAPQCTTYPMTGAVTASGSFGSAGSSLQQFPAGTYTVAAVDEWGALVVLHFTVT